MKIQVEGRRSMAFTLVELLIVIAIIGILAGFTVPVMRTIKLHQYENHARAEMEQLVTAIENYKTAYGFYPPSNPGNPLTNQLYYELVGTKLTSSAPLTFQTLDGSQTITTTQVSANFGPAVTAFVNCTKPGAGEDAPAGKRFVTELKPNQTAAFQDVILFVTSVHGPDPTYKPVPSMADLNPWRYVSPGVNNTGSYDLWMQLQVGGKKYLLCNWTKQIQVNSPLP